MSPDSSAYFIGATSREYLVLRLRFNAAESSYVNSPSGEIKTILLARNYDVNAVYLVFMNEAAFNFSGNGIPTGYWMFTSTSRAPRSGVIPIKIRIITGDLKR